GPVFSALPRIAREMRERLEFFQRLLRFIEFAPAVSPRRRSFLLRFFFHAFRVGSGDELFAKTDLLRRGFALENDLIKLRDFFFVGFLSRNWSHQSLLLNRHFAMSQIADS